MFRILVLLVVIAVIVVVILGVTRRVRAAVAGGVKHEPVADSPREILKRRYAAGEIDEDEYLRRMSGLSQDW
ncbi:SHOCT domain-containing protein [Streptosporangium sp. NPDC000509]|uniref:SHOCT domain-containing protein n=1 Tax=Streptosporangium sp. NPDC000509 TaxID=3366186 RepID=UPI00367861E1